jgi:hypothetical protein
MMKSFLVSTLLLIALTATGAFSVSPNVVLNRHHHHGDQQHRAEFNNPGNSSSRISSRISSRKQIAPAAGMTTLLKASKKENEIENNETKKPWIRIDTSKPGTLIVAPFVAIFFLDIVANILVVTKRTIEYAFTGEYTVWHF